MTTNLFPCTAMNNTFRQASGAIGTAVLVTVMATATIKEEAVIGAIHGVNVSFLVAGIVAALGFVLSFKIKNKVSL